MQCFFLTSTAQAAHASITRSLSIFMASSYTYKSNCFSSFEKLLPPADLARNGVDDNDEGVLSSLDLSGSVDLARGDFSDCF